MMAARRRASLIASHDVRHAQEPHGARDAPWVRGRYRAYRIGGMLLRVCEDAVPAIFLAALVIIVTTNVTLRYVFGNPFVGAAELSQLLFVWSVFLGASGACRRTMHVGFVVFIERLPRRIRAAAEALTSLVLTGALGVLFFTGVQLSITTHGRPMVALPLSYSVLTMALPVGAFLMGIRSIQRLVRFGAIALGIELAGWTSDSAGGA